MWTENKVKSKSDFPWILQLDAGGNPMGWIDIEDYATLRAKDNILWTTSNYGGTIRGGTNAATGIRSQLMFDTIIAIKHEKTERSKKKHDSKDFTPPLTNRLLFERDRYLCAYCGHVYEKKNLTRDHVVPVSKGGPNIWTNVVTACRGCNSWKDNKSLDEAGLQLLYVPYKPSFHEKLILENRNILADQLDFLLKGVSKDSPIYKEYSNRLAA
jgi:5-methylcytosine-specific restriction endonuclease McrA